MDKFLNLSKSAASFNSKTSGVYTPIYSHISENEKILLGQKPQPVFYTQSKYFEFCKLQNTTLEMEQDVDSFPPVADLKLVAQSFTSDFIANITNKYNQFIGNSSSVDFVQELFYTLAWVLGRISKITDLTDVLAIGDYISRIHFHKPVGKFIFDFLFDTELEAQSMDWSVLKDLVSSYEALKTHPAVIKFIKVISLAFSGGILQSLGIESSAAELWQMITETMTKIMGHTDFISAILDFVQFIGERISAFCVTGSWKSLLHTPTSYARWVDKSYDLLEKSVALGNPEALDIDYHGYMGSLISVIEEGTEIRRYIKAGDARDGVSQMLSKLRVLYNEIMLKDAAGEFRMSPFCMLISSGSGVGKSSFEDTLKTHFAKIYSKPLGSKFVYYRTPAEPHWNGFKTCMWCLIIEDVASINPNTGSTDPSLSDILLANGNTGFSPPQASLEDKGMTPFMCELVLASTNTENLMAHCWFNNPQAIRRRFPYIVNILPKAEYRIDGTNMLDPSKVPLTLPGYYPDLWHIKVKKVRVETDERVVAEVFFETSSIYEFIEKFNDWTSEHRIGQASLLKSMDMVADVVVCPIHKLPVKVCCGFESALVPQAEETDDLEPQGISLATKLMLGSAFSYGAYKTSKFVGACASEVLNAHPDLIYSPGSLVNTIAHRSLTKAQWYFNHRVHTIKIMCRDGLKKILRDALYTSYEAYKPFLKKFALSISFFAGLGLTWHFLKKEFPEFSFLEKQHSIDDVGVMPISKKEKENVWKKDDYVASEFLGRLSQSWASLPMTKVSSLLARNVVWCQTTHSVTKHTTFRATCVAGHLYVVPHHVLPIDEYFDLQVISDNTAEGCNGNIRFKVAQSCIYRRPDLELAFFEIRHMPQRRNILELFPKQGFRCDAPGRLVSRLPDGSLDYLDTKRTSILTDQFLDQFNITIDVAASTLSRDTINGDCGCPVVVQLPHASFIAGIHVLGGNRLCALAAPVTIEVIEEAKEFFDTPFVESDIPHLVGQNFTTEISQRCTARFIEEGSLEVFGSFTGFKTQPKSTACDTIFAKVLLDDGHERKFAPAPMKGYSAVHIGLKSIVQKTMTFKEDVLRHCTDSFASIVLQDLPLEFKEELRHVLPLKVALNGMPGTKFIDAMNFGTSAGYPHNKSKKHMVMRVPADEVWQHPIVVDDVIKNEITDCWTKMNSGISVSPIFMQHIKDEALPLRKVKAGEARLFMGGPFAWSVCVRMVLLPFVRVMQLNKYLFECAPGTNATSIEWTRLYHYLTKHGDDRMIAGDFKSFDKLMGSLVILEAFRFIRIILKACGATEETLTVVQVIAEDISFSFVNFNGDLMRFFGSNPSGHPLTVIVNCIVNSLYMRYVYFELNPKHEVFSFKENVALITYGDDNAIGSCVDWFNHTAISEVLSTVGVKYTMADKNAISVPFIPISEVSFLKRTFRWDEEVGAYLATLDSKSIWKSLMIFIPSKTESPQRQSVDIVRSAVSEWFFYGRERFETECSYLRELVDRVGLECYIEANTFPTWDELHRRFAESSVDYLNTEPLTTRNIIGPLSWVPKCTY